MIPFEILIDDAFEDLEPPEDLRPVDNKKVLSLVNDFEDGKWRFGRFQSFIWDNIAETALSARERASLSQKRQTALVEAAKKLRLIDKPDDSPTEGSELAEIALYGIMKLHYKALPVVPKIFYKQNNQDYAKGSDSVHIVLHGNDFSVWFGEAKFYNDISDARLGSIIKSVQNSLATDKLKKENSIITNVSDLSSLDIDPQIVERIKQLLSPDTSIDAIKPKLNIPILLLHECEITKSHSAMNDSYRNEIREFHKDRATKYFAKQIRKLAQAVNQYSEIKFHILLIPVPCKRTVVSKFLTMAQMFQDN